MNLKKLASLLLALVMLFTMIPTAAFAAEAFTGSVGHIFGPFNESQITWDSYVNTSLDRTMSGNNGFGIYARKDGAIVPIDNGSWVVAKDGVSGGDYYISVSQNSNGGIEFVASNQNTPAGEYVVSFTVGGAAASYTVKFGEYIPNYGPYTNTVFSSFKVYADAERTTVVATGNNSCVDLGTVDSGNVYYIEAFDADGNAVELYSYSSSDTNSAGVEMQDGDPKLVKVTVMAMMPNQSWHAILGFDRNGDGTDDNYVAIKGTVKAPNYTLWYSTDKINWTERPNLLTDRSTTLNIVGNGDYYLKLQKDGVDIDCTGMISPQSSMGPAPFQMMFMGGQALIKGMTNAMGGFGINVNIPNMGSFYVPMSISGIYVAPDAESDYASATVKEVTANSGNVSFGAVSGELDTANSDAAFSAPNGELLFDTTGKTPGSYDAKVGGKLYTAVIFNATGETYTSRPAPELYTEQPAAYDYVGNEDGIYLMYYLPSMSGSTFMPYSRIHQNSKNTQAVAQPRDGKLESFYVYAMQGGHLVSLAGANNKVMLANGSEESFTLSTIDVGGKTVYKITPKPEVCGNLAACMGTVVCSFNGTRVAEFSLVSMLNNEGDRRVNCGLASDTDVAGNNGNALNSMPAHYVWLDGDAFDTDTYYFAKRSGDPVQVDYLLYDKIDISTLHVKSNNPQFIDIDDFVVSDGGSNAIGFKFKVNKNDEPQEAEIEISFCYKGETTVNKWYMRAAITAPAENPGGEVVVDSVEEFKEAYATMDGGTIILKEGVYAMDIVHNSSVVGFMGEEGKEVIITGDPSSTGPIVTIKSSSIPAKWGNIIIDGDGDPADGGNVNSRALRRDGMHSPYGNAIEGVTVRDCNIGFLRTTPDESGARTDHNGAFFKNCNVGIVINNANNYVQNCRFEGCGVAIQHLTVTQWPGSVMSYIKNNTLVNNTVDIKLETSQNISFTQNYFGHGGLGGKPVVEVANNYTNNTYYAPFYTNETLTKLKADLAGTRTEDGVLDLAVNLTAEDKDAGLVVGNEATTFDTGIFAEIKGSSENLSASIPVTEAVLGDNGRYSAKVTTVWGFEKSTIDAAQEKETMDLRVTDELSAEAKAIVDEKVESGAVQYVNFAHDGDLPGTATVKVLKTNNTNAESLKLYYINEQTGEVEEADIISVTETSPDAAGNVYYIITVTHCSEYIISENLVIKTEQPGGCSGNEGSEGSGSTAPESGSAAATTPTSAKPASKPSSSANDFIGAEEVKAKLDAASGDEVTFDVSRKKLLTSKAFGLLADKPGKTMNLEGDGYSWSFDSDDITDEDAIKASNLDTSIGTESPNEKKISDALGGADHTTIHMAYNGRLPGKAEVSVDVGAENAGAKQLYLVNADGSFTHMGEVTVGEDGTVTFATDVAGDFVLLDEMLSEEPVAEPEPEAEPLPEQPAETQPAEPEKAGMPIWVPVAGIGALSIIAAIVVFIINKRRGI